MIYKYYHLIIFKHFSNYEQRNHENFVLPMGQWETQTEGFIET